MSSLYQTLQQEFEAQFAAAPQVVARAPGRVNLIGEHTDYNEGFVLPAAIDREMCIAASRRDDQRLELYSCEYKQRHSFDLNQIERNSEQWSSYLIGVLEIMNDAGVRICGFNAVLSSDIPQGAGLSSSAAFEVAAARLVDHFAGSKLSAVDLALYSQKAENDFIGVQCGIMDQFASSLGKEDCALFLDCRSLDYKAVPLNLEKNDAAIVIINSGVRRGLVDSEYNTRRQECSDGTTALGERLGKTAKSLREFSFDEFQKNSDHLTNKTMRRCKHVISENERVQKAVYALESGDLEEFGKLMYQSHESLRDDFEVSCAELDSIVDIARHCNGVYGARMTGAGFGGCAVALVRNDSVQALATALETEYFNKAGRVRQLYLCRAVDGANIAWRQEQ